MKPPPFEYRSAHDSAEAVTLLTEYGDDAKILAGGQSLVPLMNFRMARPSVLIDINQTQDMTHIHAEDGHLVVGAMTRQRVLERDQTAGSAVPLLPAALAHSGHTTNRNRGTFGGSLAHADPAAELPTVLVALGGELTVQGPSGKRTVPAEDFFLAPLVTSLEYNEILLSARLPRLPRGTGVRVEELARRHGDFAIVSVMAAVHLDSNGRADLVRIAAGGVDSTPIRLHEAEAQLSGTTLDDAGIDAAAVAAADSVQPTDDVHGSASYRLEMVRVLVARAIRSAITHQKEGHP
ncbi:xanthine dehydrogenase family protein subunit M [Haloechinothrix sp. YIM 98757]|uniref:Xanthine dehydrogenase family protein subunit M n=1 Tax=Haloechinothrix aidingensis TaxID=2752311 RepID=A0A838AD18_9PSEU|nr:xanthine dehydrogenase family protein subunit M [Haloechinothrix aidingensis]MBA0127179.1 xanthine dehydrogenase family protein subunit M [Haloechinothrix aidingensis]